MKRWFWVVGLLFIAGSVRAEGVAEEHEFLGYRPMSVRLGVGSMFGPNTFAMVGSVEYNADRFFSVGPTLQLGMSSGTTIFIPTLGGRFTAPLYFSKRVEFSIQTGVGMMSRNVDGFSFKNFDFETGANVEVFIIRNLTAGIGGIWNVTNSAVQRSVGDLFLSASYRF